MERTEAVRWWLTLPAMFLLGLLGALLVVVGPGAQPASACSCVELSDAAAFEQSDAVFVGEVVGYEAPATGSRISSADPATWTFDVSEVYKGEVTATQEVVSEVFGESCGLEIPREGVFVVFATEQGLAIDVGDGQFYAGLCGGTRSAASGPLDVDVAPSPPDRAAETAPTTVAELESEVAVGPTDSAPGTPDGLTLVIVAVAAVVVGAAILGWRRLRHRRARA